MQCANNNILNDLTFSGIFFASVKTNISINKDIMQDQCQMLKNMKPFGLYNFAATGSSFYKIVNLTHIRLMFHLYLRGV